MTVAARFFALVPCAGSGARSGVSGPKQYALLAGVSIVAHTLAALQRVRRIDAAMVVLSPDDSRFEGAAPDFDGWVERVGGATRAQTVASGLEALRRRGVGANDWVLVHDAARCLVQPEWIDALIDACEHDPVGGILAWPAADTLKTQSARPSLEAAAPQSSDAAGAGPSADHARIATTLDRGGVWQAQTPQMFRLGMLQEALTKAGGRPGLHITDEASAVEALGYSPKLIRGALENFKLTYPPDFELAERLLSSRPART